MIETIVLKGDAMKAFFILFLFQIPLQIFAAASDHQIGDEFGKTLLNPTNILENDFIKQNPFAQDVAEATAWLTHPVHGALKERDEKEIQKILCQKNLGQNHETCQSIRPNHGRYIGSAHLVGEFLGKLIMFTNSHLIHEKFCGSVTIQFVFLDGAPKVTCKEVILREESLDFAMIVVDTDDLKLKDTLRKKGINLSYDSVPKVGDSLYTIGFSHHNTVNADDILAGLDPLRISPNKAFLTKDENCKVISNDIELIRNPKKDTEVFKPRHAYSFATGCDAFLAGDCGAIYINEKTNELLGMYWTEGVEPNVSEISSKNLWTSATYGVPSSEIKRVIMDSPLALEEDYKDLLEAIFE